MAPSPPAAHDPGAPEAPRRPALGEALRAVSEGCTECLVCVRQCAFLTRHGTPKAMADACAPADAAGLAVAYECSLCGLCTAVCPFGVDPGAFYLEMRREAVERDAGPLPEHRGLLAYERKGTSARYSFYALPEGCDTVFFPGCTFSGTRSEAVLALQERLEGIVPRLGVVLDCCTKPSHDLGRDRHFHAAFGELRDYLVGCGVKTVLVACPNCYKVFRRYGGDLAVRSVYEVLAERPAAPAAPRDETVTVHDPCVMRDEADVQEAARALVCATGVRVEEMASAGRKTVCCGEGGGVGFVDPDLAHGWGRRRAAEADGRRVVTYCAGCAAYLRRHGPASHVADLLVDPDAALAGRARVARPPVTYWKRLRLKAALKKRMAGARTRERTFRPEGEARPVGWRKPLVFLALLAAAIVAVRSTGLTRYLEQDTLRGMIAGYGALAPLAYMALYTVAPALFLPGLPITVVGGILFGPFWGVVYTITSATAGACVAFLVARYFARGWVASKLVSPRWRRLDDEVERHGWKVVAFTRLVPLFPFNLLNYAFGLTRVRFLHYALATFLCMLPACIAYIAFSSSLLDLVRGRVSPGLLVGVALVAAVSALPALLRRWHGRRAEGEAAPAAYDGRRSLRAKALLLAGLAVAAGATVWVVRRYFYVLDAYVYTWEFHYLFWVNNLRAGNLARFAEYLGDMAPTGQGAAMLALAQGVQAFRLPLTAPLLPEAARQAYGILAGGLAAYGAILTATLAACGAGWLVLGDVLPLLGRRRSRAPRGWKDPAALLVALAVAIPWVPLLAGGTLAGLLRPGARRGLAAVALGSAVRVLWVLATPGLFLT